MEGWMDGMNGRTGGWMNELMNGYTDGWKGQRDEDFTKLEQSRLEFNFRNDI